MLDDIARRLFFLLLLLLFLRRRSVGRTQGKGVEVWLIVWRSKRQPRSAMTDEVLRATDASSYPPLLWAGFLFCRFASHSSAPPAAEPLYWGSSLRLLSSKNRQGEKMSHSPPLRKRIASRTVPVFRIKPLLLNADYTSSIQREWDCHRCKQ